MTNKLTGEDILSMPDDEFLEHSLNIKDEIEETSVPVSEKEVEEETHEEPEEDFVEDDEEVEDTEQEDPDEHQEPKDAVFGSDVHQEEQAAKEEQEKEVDYVQFYNEIMTPFKANGKTIELRSPQEAIQLMQQGANYTKKMQSVAPYRKTLMMLEKNGLLDEDKLSFLIDLDKKDPTAIQKYLKEAGIDPLDIDIDSETQYQQGSHRISDSEVAFTAAVEEVQGLSDGVETLQEISSNWDSASKQVLWETPQLLGVIHTQRSNGIYDTITAEVNRRKVLGSIPANASFLETYQMVGDELQRNGQLMPREANTVTRVGSPKSRVSNNEKAKAAGTTRSSSKRASGTVVNPLSLPDDEFMKQFENRL